MSTAQQSSFLSSQAPTKENKPNNVIAKELSDCGNLNLYNVKNVISAKAKIQFFNFVFFLLTFNFPSVILYS